MGNMEERPHKENKLNLGSFTTLFGLWQRRNETVLELWSSPTAEEAIE